MSDQDVDPKSWATKRIEALERKLAASVTTKYHDDLMHDWKKEVVKWTDAANTWRRKAQEKDAEIKRLCQVVYELNCRVAELKREVRP